MGVGHVSKRVFQLSDRYHQSSSPNDKKIIVSLSRNRYHYNEESIYDELGGEYENQSEIA